MEYFEIFLNSDDAISGSSTPHACSFNLGSVNDFVPNMYMYQNSNYCFVKVKYFSVKETKANFTTATVDTILIEMGGSLPNSVKSDSLTQSNPKNMIQSNIIGLVPTDLETNTYSNITYENDFVKSHNIFNGVININLKDQDLVSLTLTGSKSWTMLLCVAFEKQPDLKEKSNIDYF